jgi:hypothetical protein
MCAGVGATPRLALHYLQLLHGTVVAANGGLGAYDTLYMKYVMWMTCTFTQIVNDNAVLTSMP